MSDRQVGGPRTLAARALITGRPSARGSMRGVALGELAKLLTRVEEEAAAPYRAELEWALDQLTSGAPADPERVARARALLDRG